MSRAWGSAVSSPLPVRPSLGPALRRRRPGTTAASALPSVVLRPPGSRLVLPRGLAPPASRVRNVLRSLALELEGRKCTSLSPR